MTADHQWAANPFGTYCGVCGYQYVPDDAPPDFVTFCRDINGPGMSNDECSGHEPGGTEQPAEDESH